MENETLLLSFVIAFFFFIALDALITYIFLKDGFERMKEQINISEKSFGSKLGTFRGTLKKEIMSTAQKVIPQTDDLVGQVIQGAVDYFKGQKTPAQTNESPQVITTEAELQALSEQIREDERQKIKAAEKEKP